MDASARAIPAPPLRERLAEAAHELRRPLQILALGLEQGLDRGAAAQLLEQAARALLRLEAELAPEPPANGPSRATRATRATRAEPIPLEALVEEARRRWQGVMRVEIDRDPGAGAGDGSAVIGDRVELAAAVDNLIANAAEHGERPIRVRAEAHEDRLRLVVANEGSAPQPASSEPPRPDPRRGHGLGISARIAAEHGGTLSPPAATAHEQARVEASLELPRGGRG